MAENASVAFGRYLKTLRERRGLSLVKVCELSEVSPKNIDKGTLSRFERGRQRLAVQSLIPLSRIYAIPAEALVERLELDAELDRIGGQDTKGRSYSELQQMGARALYRDNRKWNAYACFRDALALITPSSGSGRGDEEPCAAEALLNLATVTRSLGKNHLALHEFQELENSEGTGTRMHAVVLDRISNCYRCLGDLDVADRYAARAVAEAREQREERILAYACFSRASVAIDRSDPVRAIEYLRQAFRAHREARRQDCLLAPNPSFEVSVLLHLAEAYFAAGAYEKSRGSALAAKRLSTRSALPGGYAYSELALGRVDERAGRSERAIQRWKRAGETAESVNNKRLAFSAEFYVYRRALALGTRSLARASRRRLERLAPWVPEHLPLLREYEELTTGDTQEPRTAVGRGSAATSRPRRSRACRPAQRNPHP